LEKAEKIVTEMSRRALQISKSPPSPAQCLKEQHDMFIRRYYISVLAMLAATLVSAGGQAPAEQAQDELQAARKQSVENLKQIALAMHEYAEVMGTFPPAVIIDKASKPLLSWRVLLLPYLKERDLFKQFKLDEPWDSGANKKLLERMPRVFAPPGVKTKEPFTSYYQVFLGKGAAFEGTRGLRILDFLDGTSNTILVIEGGEGVPWTKPAEISYDATKPLPKIGALFPDRIHAAFADGSVQTIRKDFKESAMRALITRNDGEPVNPADYEFQEK
jgi:Protein of unknown function (DUF1559)